ncbi:hypothetical protein KRIGEM_01364 [Komagataeibacter rhaeticus]|nr:hypothetical protein KRIGEM_01364 [Komagataeibacter rhaeticus]
MANLVHFLQYVALKQYFDMQDQKAACRVARTPPVSIRPRRPSGRGADPARHRAARIPAE